MTTRSSRTHPIPEARRFVRSRVFTVVLVIWLVGSIALYSAGEVFAEASLRLLAVAAVWKTLEHAGSTSRRSTTRRTPGVGGETNRWRKALRVLLASAAAVILLMVGAAIINSIF